MSGLFCACLCVFLLTSPVCIHLVMILYDHNTKMTSTPQDNPATWGEERGRYFLDFTHRGTVGILLCLAASRLGELTLLPPGLILNLQFAI